MYDITIFVLKWEAEMRYRGGGGALDDIFLQLICTIIKRGYSQRLEKRDVEASESQRTMMFMAKELTISI